MEKTLSLVDKAQQFWSKFGQLSNSYPLLAWIIGLIAILFIIGQFKQFFEIAIKFHSKSSKFFYICSIIIVGLSCVMLLTARYKYSNIPPGISEPLPNEQVIGEGVLLRWSAGGSHKKTSLSSSEIRYQVEFQAGDLLPELVETYEKYYNLKPSPGAFRWRVRWIIESGIDTKFYSRWTAWQKNELYHSNLQRIRMRKEIRIGITKDPIAPYYFFDQKSKSDRGIDREVAELLAKEIALKFDIMDITIHWVPRKWIEGIVSALKLHQADFAVAQTTISTNREMNYRIKFSIPYLEVPHAVITRKDRHETLAFSNLQNLRITAWRNTTGEDLARALTPQVIPSDNGPELFNHLNKGDVDAIIDDLFLAEHTVQTMSSSPYEYNVVEIPKEYVPKTYLSEYGYPDPLGIFTCETETYFLSILNEILTSSSVRNKIDKIKNYYLSQRIEH